jgi:two-component system, sensor histidine kinase and response regulator
VHPLFPATIFSDPKRLKQILMNLLSNALKFTEDGKITVSMQVEEEPGIRNRRSSVVQTFKFDAKEFKKFESSIVMKKIKIVVEDTGVGIKKKDLEKIFKKFGKL